MTIQYPKLLILLIMGFILIGCAKADEGRTLTQAEDGDGETAVSPPVEPTTPPEVATSDPILTMDAGWTKIIPDGETRCAHDTEFAFWARPGTVNKLLVYFQGGGGCWNGETCQVGSTFYDASVSNNDSPERRGGVLDFDNPENPFADYHTVYVPSCTGDVYLGDNIQTYDTDEGETIDIYHHGFVNLNASLEWAYENVFAPESIFVTGCSAGSIGSIRAAPHLIHQYPNAEVTQLGDSLGFVFDNPTSIDQIYGSHHTFPDWIPEFATFDPTAFTMADFYNTVTTTYPNYRFAQYNTEADSVQLRYHLASGDSADTFPTALANAVSQIHAASPNFRSYMADGSVHCIMPGGSFYSREVDEVSFRDWVADLASGTDVANVQCADCGVVYEE